MATILSFACGMDNAARPDRNTTLVRPGGTCSAAKNRRLPAGVASDQAYARLAVGCPTSWKTSTSPFQTVSRPPGVFVNRDRRDPVRLAAVHVLNRFLEHGDSSGVGHAVNSNADARTCASASIAGQRVDVAETMVQTLRWICPF